ncbi:glycosyltransferase family 25 protein [Tautonia sp. JC769]|uniref:glycosyltransferase family 25 protein n=1 Tax=Tautonia sp. JC769 TaxID=3232135 RepID=UPI00345A8AFD
MSLADLFERIVIVSLPSRTDRRRDMGAQLKRAGIPLQPGRVEFFDAIRPESAAGFPSIGARGCFLSHQTLLSQARDDRLANLLVIEDDLSFTPRLLADQDAAIAPLRACSWDLAYLGYRIFDPPPGASPPRGATFVPYAGRIDQTHFYAIDGPLISRLVAVLDQIRNRPPGHPEGGPMHVDGAFNTFRRQNPDVTTLIALPELGVQRDSRSDIAAGKFFDRVPVLRDLANMARSVRRSYQGGRHRGEDGPV